MPPVLCCPNGDRQKLSTLLLPLRIASPSFAALMGPPPPPPPGGALSRGGGASAPFSSSSSSLPDASSDATSSDSSSSSSSPSLSTNAPEGAVDARANSSLPKGGVSSLPRSASSSSSSSSCRGAADCPKRIGAIDGDVNRFSVTTAKAEIDEAGPPASPRAWW